MSAETVKYDEAALDKAAAEFHEKYEPVLRTIGENLRELHRKAFPHGTDRYDSIVFTDVQFDGTSYTFGFDNLDRIARGVIAKSFPKSWMSADSLDRLKASDPETTYSTLQNCTFADRLDRLSQKFRKMGEEYTINRKFMDTKDVQVLVDHCATIAAGVQVLREKWIDNNELKPILDLLVAKSELDDEVQKANRLEKQEGLDRLVASKTDDFRQMVAQKKGEMESGTEIRR